MDGRSKPHTAVLPCTNVERSTAFYAHFGFEVIKDNRNVQWPDYVGSNFNMVKGAQGRAVQLVLPQDDALQTRIDLIEWVRPRWQNSEDAKPAAERIPRVMALLTHNIRAATEALIAQGPGADAAAARSGSGDRRSGRGVLPRSGWSHRRTDRVFPGSARQQNGRFAQAQRTNVTN